MILDTRSTKAAAERRSNCAPVRSRLQHSKTYPSTERMINAAIVGLGRWGKNIVDAVGQEQVPALRARHGAASRRGARFRGAHQFELSADFADVLADTARGRGGAGNAPALCIRSIITAAGAGKAVFREKPLALTRADAETRGRRVPAGRMLHRWARQAPGHRCRS